MTSPPPLPLWWWRVVPLVAVLLVGVGGRAAAGCGDHVVLLKRGGDGQIVSPDKSATSPVLPCRGPHCSATPVKHSPPLSSVPVTTSLKDVFAACDAPDATDQPGARHPFSSPSGSPVRRATSVFHPPRF